MKQKFVLKKSKFAVKVLIMSELGTAYNHKMEHIIVTVNHEGNIVSTILPLLMDTLWVQSVNKSTLIYSQKRNKEQNI